MIYTLCWCACTCAIMVHVFGHVQYNKYVPIHVHHSLQPRLYILSSLSCSQELGKNIRVCRPPKSCPTFLFGLKAPLYIHGKCKCTRTPIEAHQTLYQTITTTGDHTLVHVHRNLLLNLFSAHSFQLSIKYHVLLHS